MIRKMTDNLLYRNKNIISDINFITLEKRHYIEYIATAVFSEYI